MGSEGSLMLISCIISRFVCARVGTCAVSLLANRSIRKKEGFYYRSPAARTVFEEETCLGAPSPVIALLPIIQPSHGCCCRCPLDGGDGGKVAVIKIQFLKVF